MRLNGVSISVAIIASTLVVCSRSEAPRPAVPPGPAEAPAPSVSEAYRSDATEEPSELVRLEELEARFLVPFRACAIGPDLPEDADDAEVARRIEAAAAADAAAFAARLRTDAKCLPLLDAGVPAYRALAAGSAAGRDCLEKVADRVDAVRSSWSVFADVLEGTDIRPRLVERIKQDGNQFAGYEGAIETGRAEHRAKYRPRAVAYYHFVDCALGDIDYGSFEGVPETTDAAHYKIVAYLDSLCMSERDAFLARLQLDCARFLFASPAPAPDGAFERAVVHWVKQGGDYGSAVPLWECLAPDPPIGREALAGQLARTLRSYEEARAALCP